MQQSQAPLIKQGKPAQLERLVDALSDAFGNDPVMNWVLPAPQIYPTFFRMILRDVYFPRGIVHHDSESRGCALWLPPGEYFDLRPGAEMLGMLGKLVMRKGPIPLWRIHRQGQLFSRHHPKEPHYYLQFVGCRQHAQGRGIGSALLKQGTRLCDEHNMPAYLESSNQLNVPLYQRHGFEILAKENLPAGGPSTWFMWRPARAVSLIN